MFTGGFWRNLTLGLVVGAGILGVDAAFAAPGSAICRSIEAQLSRGTNGAPNSRFSAAAERQRQEIGKIRGQMAAAGCGFLGGSSRCGELSRMASRMNANLAKLSAKAGGGGKSRAQLLASLEANECRGARKQERRRENSQGIMARLFGEPAPSRQRDNSLSFWRQTDDQGIESDAPREIKRVKRELRAPTTLPGYGTAGTVRTFCVRTCDGYYFPISPASSQNDMARDEQNCRAACPGAETALYYQDTDQEDAAEMMSRMTGQRYGQLKTAFVYRAASSLKAPQCTCAAQSGGLAKAKPANPVEPPIPLPSNRPDPKSDPETLANLVGDLTAASIRQMLSGDSDPNIAQRQVRVVGPAFLPDQSMAADPQAQGQTLAR